MLYFFYNKRSRAPLIIFEQIFPKIIKCSLSDHYCQAISLNGISLKKERISYTNEKSIKETV